MKYILASIPYIFTFSLCIFIRFAFHFVIIAEFVLLFIIIVPIEMFCLKIGGPITTCALSMRSAYAQPLF